MWRLDALSTFNYRLFFVWIARNVALLLALHKKRKQEPCISFGWKKLTFFLNHGHWHRERDVLVSVELKLNEKFSRFRDKSSNFFFFNLTTQKNDKRRSKKNPRLRVFIKVLRRERFGELLPLLLLLNYTRKWQWHGFEVFLFHNVIVLDMMLGHYVVLISSYFFDIIMPAICNSRYLSINAKN